MVIAKIGEALCMEGRSLEYMANCLESCAHQEKNDTYNVNSIMRRDNAVSIITSGVLANDSGAAHWLSSIDFA